MSLQWFVSRSVPEDTAAIGRELFRPGKLYREIGDRFDEFCPDEKEFALLYEPTGRGAIAPLLVALVTIFQMMERVPDRQAAELVVSRLDWKYALHLPLLYAGFHFTDLYAFRVRLVAHGKERLVFDQILAKLKALGLFKPRGKMRTDSTHLLGVVQRLSQLELISECLRVALRAVSLVAGSWVESCLPPAFCESYEERESLFGMSDEKVKKRLTQVAKDASWFLAQVDGSAPTEAKELPEVGTLRTVLSQQFPQGPGGPASKRPTGGDIIETPHETEARYAIKRGRSWIGYKLQATETCDDERPHLIVDVEVTAAYQNDSPQLLPIQERLEVQGTLPGEQLVDQGYMSGENLVKSAERGIELLGNPLQDTQSPAGFRQGNFHIDEQAQQAVCPAGQKSRVWAIRQSPRQERPAIQIRFPAEACRCCSFFGKCTTSKQGRSLTLHPYRAALLARRQEAQMPSFQKRLHLRAGIESTLSEAVRGHGLRRARYRGRIKVGLQAYFTAAAIDLKRAIRWLTNPPIPENLILSCC